MERSILPMLKAGDKRRLDWPQPNGSSQPNRLLGEFLLVELAGIIVFARFGAEFPRGPSKPLSPGIQAGHMEPGHAP